MTFTLRSHGRALGHTGAELPPPAPGMRSWHFHPDPSFAEVRPLFAALPKAIEESEEVIPTQGELAAIPEEEREQRMREMFLSDPRMRHFIELSGQLEALALELQGTDGRTLDTRTIGVTELDLPAAAFGQLLEAVNPRYAMESGASPPFFLLVAGLV